MKIAPPPPRTVDDLKPGESMDIVGPDGRVLETVTCLHEGQSAHIELVPAMFTVVKQT